MFEEGRFLRDISTGSTTQAVVMASFTPCSLMADRLGFYGSMLVGGRTGFVPNNLEVMPAIRSLRVTALSAPPLLWNTIHNEYARQRERMVAEEGGRQQADVEAIENKLRIEFREKLGDRCSTVGTGGAPCSKAILNWMKETFGVGADLVGENYGCTEIGNIATNGYIDSKFVGGTEASDYHVKLADLPDLGFLSTDLPYPRGEVLVKTPNAFAGYFGDADCTAQAWTSDGYYRTGDVAEFDITTGRIKVIGRCKEVLKTSTGEFVAPAKLEADLSDCEGVHSVFILVPPMGSHVVCVVLPEEDSGSSEGADEDERKHAMESLIRRRLRTSAILHNHKPHEIARHVLFEWEERWTVENGYLNGSQKPVRSRLTERYSSLIQSADLASVGSAGDTDELSLKDQLMLKSGSVEERLVALVLELLQLERAEFETAGAMEESFSNLGADSMQAMQFMSRLQEISPRAASSLDSLVLHKPLRAVASLMDDGTAVAPHMLQAWRQGEREALERSLDSDSILPELQQGPPVTPNADAAGSDFLLTGGTGFVGSHVLSELLLALFNDHEVRQRGTRVFCVVRASDAQHAERRLAKQFAKSGYDERRIVFEPLAKALDTGVSAGLGQVAVVVIAGSLEDERFGLSASNYSSLSMAVGSVIHVAAKVAFWSTYNEVETRRFALLTMSPRLPSVLILRPTPSLSRVATPYLRSTFYNSAAAPRRERHFITCPH
mmetsp:Transcript_83842/g.237039  ORF Transcript_83842/g.237039 Transcript_83842/m.237039 type:complete len:722 (+) Transcript_83842:2218-4383(+)